MAKPNMAKERTPMPVQDPVLRAKNFEEVALVINWFCGLSPQDVFTAFQCIQMQCWNIAKDFFAIDVFQIEVEFIPTVVLFGLVDISVDVIIQGNPVITYIAKFSESEDWLVLTLVNWLVKITIHSFTLSFVRYL